MDEKENGKIGGNKEDLEHATGWGERIKEVIFRNNQDGLSTIESICKGLVKAVPLSYLALHYTRKEPFKVLGVSSVFMEQFHYSYPEQLTFENIFEGPADLVDLESLKRALSNPLHMQFSIPLFDGRHREALVYVAKRDVSTRDLYTRHFSREEERHYYLLLEVNRIGDVQRSRNGGFKSCKYARYITTSTPYECRVKAQVRIMKKENPKRDRAVHWDLLGA